MSRFRKLPNGYSEFLITINPNIFPNIIATELLWRDKIQTFSLWLNLQINNFINFFTDKRVVDNLFFFFLQ